MKRLLASALIALAAVGSARAQFFSSTDTSNLATKNDITTIQSAMPKPSSVVPPTDVYGGSVGADSSTYQRADAARPRVTRSMLVTLDATGSATADWSSQPLTVGGVVNLTPIYSSASGIPKCWVTAQATTTSVPIKCAIENSNLINLSIITGGLTLNSNVGAAGMKVNVVVLPPSQ